MPGLRKWSGCAGSCSTATRDQIKAALAAGMPALKVDPLVLASGAGVTGGQMGTEKSRLDFDLAEVRVSRAILRQARERWLVTDSAKLAQKAPIRVVSLRELDAVFIDRPLPEGLGRVCAEGGTRVVVASEGA